MRSLLPLTSRMGPDSWRKRLVCRNPLGEFRRPPQTTTSQPQWRFYETPTKFMTRSRPRGEKRGGKRGQDTTPASQPARHYRSSPPPGPAQRPHQGQRAVRAGRESPPAAQGAGGASSPPIICPAVVPPVPLPPSLLLLPAPHKMAAGGGGAGGGGGGAPRGA